MLTVTELCSRSRTLVYSRFLFIYFFRR